MGQQVTEVMCCAAPRSLRPLQHKFWRSKQKGNSWSLSDWCQPVPLSFQLLYSISLSYLFCLHLYLFSLIKDRFTHMCAHTHTHTHTHMKHTHVCAHMYDTHRGTHSHAHTQRTICVLSAYLGQSYAPPAVSVILQIHLQPETENSDMSCTPLANRLSTIPTNNVYVYYVHHYIHHCMPKKCHFN